MSTLKKWIYLIVAAAIVLYLYSLGKGPWIKLAGNYVALITVIVITAISLLIQTYTYLLCLSNNSASITYGRLLHIWSSSSAISLITPLLGGLTLRIGILKLYGITIREASLASIRQALANLDVALLLTSLILVLAPVTLSPYLGLYILFVWLLARLTRGYVFNFIYNKTGFDIAYPTGLKTRLWMMAQTVLVTLNFLCIYHLFGADIQPGIAILLTLASLSASILTLLPNGLGLLDTLWVYVATTHSLGIDESVAIALTFRFGGLLSSAMIFVLLSCSNFLKNANDS